MIDSQAEQPVVIADQSGGSPPEISTDEAESTGSPRRWGWYEAAFAAVILAALALRLFELSGRAMHYDEAIHLHYGWRLANSAGALLGWPWIFGTDYVHSAWMHGPFQIEMTAVIFTIFGDTDFTARMGYAIFGTALVALPYFLREHIGRHGAIVAAVMLSLSPVLLYFSRFGRNDIIMMFWAVALFTLMWRYLHGGRRVHLYAGSAVLALMFATKETAYLLVAIFGLTVFLASLPEILPWLQRRAALPREGTPVAVFLLLFTLTLPQWSALIGLFQGILGLTLANPDALTGNNVASIDGSAGMTGAPAWQGSIMLLPVADVPWIFHAALAVAALALLSWLLSRGPLNQERVAGLVGTPLLSAFAFAWILFRPCSGVDPDSAALRAADFVIFFIALAVAGGFLLWSRYSLGRAALLVLLPASAITVYSLLFTPVLNVQGLVDAVLQGSMSVGITEMGGTSQLRRRRWYADSYSRGLGSIGHLVDREELAHMCGNLLRGLDRPLHHNVHQPVRDLHRLLAGHGVLDRPTGRGPWKSAVVLLFRRAVGLRTVATGLRRSGSGVFPPAPGCSGPGTGAVGRSFAGGLHGGDRKDAVAGGEHHHAVYSRRRKIPRGGNRAAGVAFTVG